MDQPNYENIFHEMKNIITLIGSSLQLIEKQHPEVSDYAYWSDTRADINMLKQLLLNLSANKCFKLAPPELTDIPQFLEDLATNTSFLLGDGTAFQFITEPGLPPLWIDKTSLKQACINLIKNAKEAMGNTGLLTVNTYKKENSLFFEITDTGCGMDQATLAQLYTPHFTSKTEGSGLGLFITSSIIHAQGGDLSCISALGEGTTFTIRLPYSEAYEKAKI